MLVGALRYHCDPPRARENDLSLLFRNSQQYYLFVCHYSERTHKSFRVMCQIFFFPHAHSNVKDNPHKKQRRKLFFLFLSVSSERDRSITAREERTRSARDTKKGKRVVCSSRELARARLREREKKREREVRGRVKIRSLHFSGITFKNISLAL